MCLPDGGVEFGIRIVLDPFPEGSKDAGAGVVAYGDDKGKAERRCVP